MLALATPYHEIAPATFVTRDKEGDELIYFTCKHCGREDYRVRNQRGPRPTVCDVCLEKAKHPGSGTEHGDHPTLDGRETALRSGTLPITEDEALDLRTATLRLGRRAVEGDH